MAEETAYQILGNLVEREFVSSSDYPDSDAPIILQVPGEFVTKENLRSAMLKALAGFWE